MEHSGDVESAVTPTAAGAERPVCETHSPRADALEFLDDNDSIRDGGGEEGHCDTETL